MSAASPIRPDSPAAVIARWVEAAVARVADGAPVVLGLSGPQGAGKSTISAALDARFGADLVVLGLDDVYLPKAARADMARTVSPLFAVRGPPGTHDLALLNAVLDALCAGQSDVAIPSFDKNSDDRRAETTWRRTKRPAKIVLLEGWCVGARLSADFTAAPALNAAEARDLDGAWRAHQAAQLAGPYAELWSRLGRFAHLQAPDFAAVLTWRLEQEAANRGVAREALSEAQVAWVADFIQHYERITRAMAAGERWPGLAIQLDAGRAVTMVTDEL